MLGRPRSSALQSIPAHMEACEPDRDYLWEDKPVADENGFRPIPFAFDFSAAYLCPFNVQGS